MKTPTPHIIEIPHGSAAYDATVALRQKWLRDPLGVKFTDADWAADARSRHLACYLDQELVGCVVLTPLDERSVRMRQLVVRPDCQRQGLGKALVEYSEDLARRSGYAMIVLHARDVAVAFYDRLDYRHVGEPFIEVSIPHQGMEKDL